MIRLGNLTCAARVIRIGQTMPSVDFTPQVIKSLFCRISRRADIQAFSCAKLDTGRHKMQLVMPGMAVSDPQNVVLVSFKPGERDLLKAIHELLLHFRRYFLVRGERQHAGGVFVPEIE